MKINPFSCVNTRNDFAINWKHSNLQTHTRPNRKQTSRRKCLSLTVTPYLSTPPLNPISTRSKTLSTPASNPPNPPYSRPGHPVRPCPPRSLSPQLRPLLSSIQTSLRFLSHPIRRCHLSQPRLRPRLRLRSRRPRTLPVLVRISGLAASGLLRTR